MSEDQAGNVKSGGWQKNKPPAVLEPEPEVLQEVVEERPLVSINVGPLNDITKDTHTRLAQYLGIVNPGVLRVMADMLREQEVKIINFLAGAGVKLG